MASESPASPSIDDPEPTPAGSPDPTIQPLPRWSPWMTLLTGWWLPATTARRTQHVSLLSAFIVHVVVTLVTPVLIAAIICACVEERFIQALGQAVREISREFERNPQEATLILLRVIGSIEGGFVGLALLLGPWGARDERIRDTIANALRHTWLHTAAMLPLLLLLVAGLATVENRRVKIYQARNEMIQRQIDAESLRWAEQYYYSSSPRATMSAEEQERLHKAQRRLGELYSKYGDDLPWYCRHIDDTAGWTTTCAGLAALWALMRAIGARRSIPATARPPMCEECGYNLTTQPLDARCPECGQKVADSLGPDARSGAPWEHRRRLGRLRAWWRTSVEITLRPARLGRQLRVLTPLVDHRLFLAAHVVAFFFAGYLLALIADVAGRGPRRFSLWYTLANIANLAPRTRFYFEEAPAFGMALFTGALGIPLLAAGIIGLWVGHSVRRNLLPAAMQAAAYLSGYLMLCTLMSASLLGVLIVAVQYEVLIDLRRLLKMDDALIAMAAWALVTLVLLIEYVIQLYRATMASRYANR